MTRLFLIAAASLGLLAAAAADDTKPNDKTLGRKPPEKAEVLFDGKDLTGWVKPDGSTPAAWPVADGAMAVGKGKDGGNILTKKRFGDFKLHLEFNVPLMPDAKGQARGNSGVYLDGLYELQVLDSYGLDPKTNDCGAIYQQIAPSVNACKPPLHWQTYDVTFHKARREGDKVVKKARVTVVQNGVTIIDDKEISVTPGGVGGLKEGDDGPILLQDHGNDVRYRNIWIVPIN
ncbi:MAG TPA: DUF1080 domain-containing protein [Isosphaeraceae bacterium]|jgi:hypothetical protein|nr:DUF1080 domain-containing protein [Isosphaeraceae bacterium]